MRPKVAIVHPQFIEGGGSEAPALWAAEALKKDYDVNIIAMGRINIESLNKSYGTNLNLNDIKIVEIPIPRLFRNRFDALRGYRLDRYCKQHAFEFDLMFSSYNVMDFGKKGVQYISDFSFDDRLRRAFDIKPEELKSLFYRASPLRSFYLKLSALLSGGSKDGWKRNLTVVNSAWSGRIMREVYGIETQTIYPPVVGGLSDIPWEKRENGFVCIGRLVPEKRIDRLIEILRKIREKGWDIHLHIIGKSGNAVYIKELRELCKKHNSWIFMEGGLFGKEKSDFIGQHKFGIHGREKEPFGIAVAEMVKAGCITFVPSEGGQAEIVNNPELSYENLDGAVKKIDNALRNQQLQKELRMHLIKQAERFTVSDFMDNIRAVARQFLLAKREAEFIG